MRATGGACLRREERAPAFPSLISPPPKLPVQPQGVVPHPLGQLRSPQDPLHPVDGDAVDEEQQRRQGADAEARGEGRVGVGIDLHYLDVSSHAVGAVLLHDWFAWLCFREAGRVRRWERGEGQN